MKTKLIAFATAVLCTVAISLGLAGKVYTVSAMDYGRTYNYYLYSSCRSGTYTLYGEDIVSAVSTRSGLVDDRVPDKENIAVVWTSTGTGFIVDDHVIATNAHCVYNDDGLVRAMRVKIYNEDCSQVLDIVDPVEVHIPNAYILNRESNKELARQYDYALLYVTEDISQYGMLPLGVPTDDFMSSGATVYSSGFPQATSTNPYANSNTRLVSSGKIMDFRGGKDAALFERKIVFNNYSSEGNSGGPVYVSTTCLGKTYKTAIGILHGGSKNKDKSYGVRVTSDLLMFYYNNPNLGAYEWY